jgi:hypothetical protein
VRYTGGAWSGGSRRSARVEADYRRLLNRSVEFEKRIRDRWRQKCRAKNECIAELEARVVELERRLGEE